MTNDQFKSVFHDLPKPEAFHARWEQSATSRSFLEFASDMVADRIADQTDAAVVPPEAVPSNFSDVRQLPHLYPDVATPLVLRKPFGKQDTLDTIYVTTDERFLCVENQRGVKSGHQPNIWANLLHPARLYVFGNPGRYWRLYHGIDLWGDGDRFRLAEERFMSFVNSSEQAFNNIYPSGFEEGFKPARLLLRHKSPRMKSERMQELEQTFLGSSVEDYMIDYGDGWPSPSL